MSIIFRDDLLIIKVERTVTIPSGHRMVFEKSIVKHSIIVHNHAVSLWNFNSMIYHNIEDLPGSGSSRELWVSQVGSWNGVQMVAGQWGIVDISLRVLFKVVSSLVVQIDVSSLRIIVRSQSDAIDVNWEVQVCSVNSESYGVSGGSHGVGFTHLPRSIQSLRVYDNSRIATSVVSDVSEIAVRVVNDNFIQIVCADWRYVWWEIVAKDHRTISFQVEDYEFWRADYLTLSNWN